LWTQCTYTWARTLYESVCYIYSGSTRTNLNVARSCSGLTLHIIRSFTIVGRCYVLTLCSLTIRPSSSQPAQRCPPPAKVWQVVGCILLHFLSDISPVPLLNFTGVGSPKFGLDFRHRCSVAVESPQFRNEEVSEI